MRVRRTVNGPPKVAGPGATVGTSDAADEKLCVDASLDVDDDETSGGSGNMPGNSFLMKAVVVSTIPEQHVQ